MAHGAGASDDSGANREWNEKLKPRLLAGEREAVEELFLRVRGRLLASMQQQFGARVAREGQSGEDAIQSAFRTFLVRLQSAKIELRSWGELVGFLTRIAVNKYREAHRSRKVRVQLSQLADPEASDSPDSIESVSPEPSALDQLLDEELIAVIHRDLDSLRRHLIATRRPSYWEVFKLKLDGLTGQEIADQMGCSEPTVRRMYQRALDFLVDRYADVLKQYTDS